MSWFPLVLLAARALAGEMTVEVLDVGQGDAVLVRSPAGKTVLIDAGTGRRDVVPMLRARGIEDLNLVIATHAHADHIGGLDEVLEAFPVRLYGDQGLPHTTATYTRLMELVETQELRYLTLRAGRSFKLDDDIRIEVLAPTEPLLTGTRSDLNSNSVVTRLTHGSNCFLFTGDAEEPTEHQLIASGVGPCEVLKVAHHGSAHSTTEAWLAAVQPEIALISVGARNRYGHPDEDTLGRLEAAGATVYRTDLHGTLKVTSNKRRIQVEEVDERAMTDGMASAPQSPALGEHLPVAEPGAKTPKTAEGALATALPRSARPQLASALPRPEGLAGAAEGIDVNSASPQELQTIPGIGPAKAQAIVAYRSAQGPFTTLADLDAVPGIGPATLEAMRPRIRFGP